MTPHKIANCSLVYHTLIFNWIRDSLFLHFTFFYIVVKMSYKQIDATKHVISLTYLSMINLAAKFS